MARNMTTGNTNYNTTHMTNDDTMTRNTTTTTTNVTREVIAERAYNIYQRRGCTPGHEMQDWLQAEEELRRETRRTR